MGYVSVQVEREVRVIAQGTVLRFIHEFALKSHAVQLLFPFYCGRCLNIPYAIETKTNRKNAVRRENSGWFDVFHTSLQSHAIREMPPRNPSAAPARTIHFPTSLNAASCSTPHEPVLNINQVAYVAPAAKPEKTAAKQRSNRDGLSVSKLRIEPNDQAVRRKRSAA